MNREDIIKLAREASNNASGLYEEKNDLVMLYLDELERFAALVAAAEREACGVIAETPISGEQDDITMQAKDRVADAIRARGNT